jgi:hypothetical protein
MKIGINFLGIAILVIVIGFSMSGCDKDDVEGIWIDNIDDSSHINDAGFFVDNLSSHKLVAFAGSVSQMNLLGGIPPRAENHGIFRNPNVFNRTRSIVVIIVREDQLIEHNKNNTLTQLSNNPFTSLMVLYNHGMDNTHRHRISERAGGRHRLIVANPTNHNVEFRINSPLAGGGDVLGFSPRLALSTVFHLTDHISPNVETLVFPVFRFFHPINQVVSEIYPVWPSGPLAGTPWFRNLPTAADLPNVNETINVQDILADFKMELGAVWIVIENSSSSPITVFQGSTALPNSMGTFQIPYVAPNNRRTLVFNARENGTGQPLPHLNISNLGVGPTVALRTNDIVSNTNATTFQLLPEYRYRVLVTGSIAQGFTAVIDLNGTLVNIQELIQDQE